VTVRRLSVRDFRSYGEAELQLSPGVTVISGRNGTGKTNLLEAIGYLATLKSFRGTPSESLLRLGTDRAVVRGELLVESRSVLIETEIVVSGRARTLVNKQTLKRTRDLAEVLRVSVFSPEDLTLVKGGPAERRDWLDAALAAQHPRYGALLDDVERVLKQRNALLKQVSTTGKGRLDEGAALTLEVWDTKFSEIGTELTNARLHLLNALRPVLVQAYADIAEAPMDVRTIYGSSWLPVGHDQTLPVEASQLHEALLSARGDEVRRGTSLAGPHRDDVVLSLVADGLVRPSRTHASQGEQRTLALSMRLAVHRHLTELLGVAPLLLLDDVFSELDPQRSAALVHHLPVGQAVLATAIGAPPGVMVDGLVEVIRVGGVSSAFGRSVGTTQGGLDVSDASNVEIAPSVPEPGLSVGNPAGMVESVGNPVESVDRFALENTK
jgi:DNA replication and repair protein RecF